MVVETVDYHVPKVWIARDFSNHMVIKIGWVNIVKTRIKRVFSSQNQIEINSMVIRSISEPP